MSILKLLEDPFGPYEDFRILNPAWPRYRNHPHRPKLTSVHMKCGGADIGLDEMEFLQEAPPSSRIVTHQVKVIGVLEIEKLDWLSGTGREWLESDLRRRDDEKKTAAKPSQLTLEAIYGDGVNSGSKISIWLKFDKILSAAYMTLDDDPTSLVLHARDQNRLFCIETLDVLAHDLSRNFFERYRIRRLIQELVDGSISGTLIQDRNIDWLVKQYLAQVVPMDSFSRIIYRPDISSAVYNQRGDMVLKKPRHRRTIHKATVREIFARQAEWILADQIGSLSYNARILDIPSWVGFVKQVKAARRSARAQGMRWGEPWNHFADTVTADRDVVDGHDLTRFGGTLEKWNQFLRNALANPLHSQQKLIQKAIPTRGPPTRLPSTPLTSKKPPPQQAKPEPSKPRNLRIAPAEYQYDSDFSEASTVATTDSEDEDSTDSENTQQLDAKVPWYCLNPPILECTQHVWKCPGCDSYTIDLLQPDEDELEEIPEHYAELLRLKNWTKVTEQDVVDALACLVDNHFTSHLRALGIQTVTKDDKVSVRKWPEERKRKSRRLNRNLAPK